MGHVAVLNYPAHGHINPTLPIVGELVRRGHRVSYVVAEQYAGTVEAAGATAVTYRSHMPSSWDTVTLPERITADVVAEMSLAQVVEGFAALEPAHAVFARDRPDVMLYDAFGYPTGRLLARAWSLPAALLCSTFVGDETFSPYTVLADRIPMPEPDHPALQKAHSTVRDALTAYGLDETPEAFAESREALRLVFLPRGFQHRGDGFDDRFAFVGPCLGARAGSWRRPAHDRPVLLVTLGSFGYHDQPGFLRQCLAAFEGSPWHVVMAIGRTLDAADLGPLPDNVEAHPWVPQLDVLRAARGFISHAGMGSTMEALAFGVAPVVVPRTPEQEIVADRLVELGLGRRLEPDALDADALRAAVDGLDTDADAHERVRHMQADIAGAGGAARAADLVEEMAWTR